VRFTLTDHPPGTTRDVTSRCLAATAGRRCSHNRGEAHGERPYRIKGWSGPTRVPARHEGLSAMDWRTLEERPRYGRRSTMILADNRTGTKTALTSCAAEWDFLAGIFLSL
jgi:hypothetical protein